MDVPPMPRESALPRSRRPFQPEEFGRYTLLMPLASGGMGDVYVGRITGAEGFEKFVIIKKIVQQLAREPDFVARFVDEAKIVVNLHYGSIAQILDMGIIDGEYFIAMEYVDGKDLRRILQRCRERGERLPLGIGLFTMVRVLDALSYAHRKKAADGSPLGVVHRDISPQNVLISYEGEVKVIDFGLAKSALSLARTNPSMILGKFFYMSPEQARHYSVDRRADIYSAGIVLWELLAGRNPFDDVPPADVMRRVADPQIPPILSVAPSVPRSVSDVVNLALSIEPEHRFQTAEAMRNRLTSAMLEVDPNVGPETVANFMNEHFAAEYKAERELMATLSQRRLGSPATRNSAARASGPETDSTASDSGDDLGGSHHDAQTQLAPMPEDPANEGAADRPVLLPELAGGETAVTPTPAEGIQAAEPAALPDLNSQVHEAPTPPNTEAADFSPEASTGPISAPGPMPPPSEAPVLSVASKGPLDERVSQSPSADSAPTPLTDLPRQTVWPVRRPPPPSPSGRSGVRNSLWLVGLAVVAAVGLVGAYVLATYLLRSRILQAEREPTPAPSQELNPVSAPRPGSTNPPTPSNLPSPPPDVEAVPSKPAVSTAPPTLPSPAPEETAVPFKPAIPPPAPLARVSPPPDQSIHQPKRGHDEPSAPSVASAPPPELDPVVEKRKLYEMKKTIDDYCKRNRERERKWLLCHDMKADVDQSFRKKIESPDEYPALKRKLSEFEERLGL
jgi:eukaryotic-like serine/threonine-protein kinase